MKVFYVGSCKSFEKELSMISAYTNIEDNFEKINNI